MARTYWDGRGGGTGRAGGRDGSGALCATRIGRRFRPKRRLRGDRVEEMVDCEVSSTEGSIGSDSGRSLASSFRGGGSCGAVDSAEGMGISEEEAEGRAGEEGTDVSALGVGAETEAGASAPMGIADVARAFGCFGVEVSAFFCVLP